MLLILVTTATAICLTNGQLPVPYGYPLPAQYTPVRNYAKINSQLVSKLGDLNFPVDGAGSRSFKLLQNVDRQYQGLLQQLIRPLKVSKNQPSNEGSRPNDDLLLLLLQPATPVQELPNYRHLGLGPKNLMPIGPPAPGPHFVPKPPFAPPPFRPVAEKLSQSQRRQRHQLAVPRVGQHGPGALFILPLNTVVGRNQAKQ